MLDPIELSKALIRCPSVTPHEAGALDLLENILKPLGFECRRMVFVEDGFEPVDNLYARFGTAAPHLCFGGHVDVVPPGDLSQWSHPPYEPTEKDGYLYGRGAEDMKAAIAAFVSATAGFVQQPFAGSLSFIITCDEEGGAIHGTKKVLERLASEGKTLDAAIVGEPTNPERIGEMVKIGRRGSANYTLTVRGTQGHVAYPQLADNPLTRLVAMLQALKSATLDKGNAYFPPSNLEITSIDVGNPAVNVIPEKGVAHFNVRFNDHYTSETLDAWLRSILDKIGPYELACRVSGESFLTPPGPLSDLLSGVIEKIAGIKPELSTTGGTSDARYFKNYCPVVEFGVTNRTAHKIDERVKLADVRLLESIYSEFLKAYFRAK